MSYGIILKMAGISLGTIIVEQVLQRAGKQTEAVIIALISVAILLLLGITTISDVGKEVSKLFEWGSL